MSPLTDEISRGIATIQLSEAEERLVRSGTVVWDDAFEAELARSILRKLRSRLETVDLLRTPVGSTPRPPKVERPARFTLADLDL